MRFEAAVARLSTLPTSLPNPPAELMPRLLPEQEEEPRFRSFPTGPLRKRPC